MSRPSLGFVDANVLADAILAEELIQEIYRRKRNRKQALQEIDNSLNSNLPLKHAHDLFQLLQQPLSPIDFVVTSNLALIEARHVIAEDFIKGKNSRRRTKTRLLEVDLAHIYIRIWLGKRKVGHAMIVQDDFDISLCEHLVTEFGCNARDAILIATATQNQCRRFITSDNRLKKLLRDFKEIQLVQAQAIVDEIKFYYKSHDVTKLRSTDAFANRSADEP